MVQDMNRSLLVYLILRENEDQIFFVFSSSFLPKSKDEKTEGKIHDKLDFYVSVRESEKVRWKKGYTGSRYWADRSLDEVGNRKKKRH